MAPNVSDLGVMDPTLVSDFQADAAVFEKPASKKRVVKVHTFAMEGDVPEKGSWHYERKKQILAEHPEIKELYGRNPWSFAIMLAAAVAHVFVAVNLASSSWWVLLFVSYTLGAYLNWICLMMGHEGSHGLVFESRALNKLHVIIAFLPCFFGPFGSYWAIDHMFHHQVIVDKMNRYGPQHNGLPKKILFTILFTNVAALVYLVTSSIALVKVASHMVLYQVGLRSTPHPPSYRMKPFKSFPQVANTPWFFVNFALSIAFVSAILVQFGYVPLVYLFLSNSWCNGLHPLGMRQVQEHYLQRKDQPTNSVYSPLSLLLCNVGYHTEHHDFPAVPWNRLPEITKLAPRYYKTLYYYTSYTEIWTEFFTNPGIPYTVLLEDS